MRLRVFPSPDESPQCLCRGNAMKAFFCPWGHMTECHYPHQCGEALCSHLAKYDLDPAVIDGYVNALVAQDGTILEQV
jgi:hypothetical protein